MDKSTKAFVIGLLFFTLGSMFLAGYFFAPGRESNGSNSADSAMPLGVSLMVLGFVVLLVNSCCYST